jgi:hypothetical protein
MERKRAGRGTPRSRTLDISEADFEEVDVKDIKLPGSVPVDNDVDLIEAAEAESGTGEGPLFTARRLGVRADGTPAGRHGKRSDGSTASPARGGAGAAADPSNGTGPSAAIARSDNYDQAVDRGRQILKEMIQRFGGDEQSGAERPGVAQALRGVALGYRTLEKEVARLTLLLDQRRDEE